MKKPLSLVATVIILITFAFLYFYIISKILLAIEPPWYFDTFPILIFYVVLFEIWFRLRPWKYAPPSVFLLSLSSKDRTVFLVASLFYVVTISVLAEIKYSPLITRFIYLAVGLILCNSPIILFGSKELKQKIFGKKNEPNN